ncbi:hypothetical protein CMO88_05015 [Candidatus Woesearchaeota archaeon]|nr:hypothetical protein [Candidatus Woesearchaeota archaeon]
MEAWSVDTTLPGKASGFDTHLWAKTPAAAPLKSKKMKNKENVAQWMEQRVDNPSRGSSPLTGSQSLAQSSLVELVI